MNKYINLDKQTLALISKEDEEFKEYLNIWISECKDFIKDKLRRDIEFPPAIIIKKFRKEHQNWAIEDTHTDIIIRWVEHFRKQILIENGGELE